MKARQRGQALPFGLAMILVATLGALVLYNTGRTAADKARLANAADAAAYSGLLWQARALNFQAYTNRAMVANQVSMAQAVSLSSWANHGRITTRSLRNALGAFPYVGPLMQGAHTVMSTLDGVVQPVTGAMLRVSDIVNRGLSLSQEALFASSFVATPEIVDDVIRAGDAQGRFTARTAYGLGGLYTNLLAWRDFTERHDPASSAMDERAALIMDSRDDFSTQRDWKFFDSMWVYSSPITRHKLFRAGSTRLVAIDGPNGRRWEWKAKDTLALQTRRLRWTGREKKSELPIGWAESYANRAGRSSHLTAECRRLQRLGRERDDCEPWGKNKRAEKYGAREAVGLGGYRGLQAFRTINARLLGNDGRGGTPTLDEEPLIRLRVEASMHVRDARSSADSIGGDTFEVGVAALGDRLSSISAAEVYYRRPDAVGNTARAREAANGYNPYWDVRLAPVSEGERLLAAALRPGAIGDVLGDTAVAPDGGAARPGGGLAGEGAAALARDVTRYAALTIADIEGFAPAAARRAADVVRDALVDELRRAPREILAGIGDRVLGGVAAHLEGIDVPDVEQAIDAVEDLSARYRDVATVVADDIGNYLDELVATRVRDIAPGVAHIDALVDEIANAAEGEREALRQRLDELIGARDEALATLRDDIAEHLVEVVERHVPEWRMPRVLAAETVESILAEFSGQLGVDPLDGVRWVFDDEEDAASGEGADEHEHEDGNEHGEDD